MKAKVTKVIAKELSKAVKGNYCIESIDYFECTPQDYQIYVRWDLYNHDIDYDFIKGKYKFIEVTYKDECYAPSKFLTTYDIQKLLQNVSAPTFENFVNAFLDAYQI